MSDVPFLRADPGITRRRRHDDRCGIFEDRCLHGVSRPILTGRPRTPRVGVDTATGVPFLRTDPPRNHVLVSARRQPSHSSDGPRRYASASTRRRGSQYCGWVQESRTDVCTASGWPFLRSSTGVTRRRLNGGRLPIPTGGCMRQRGNGVRRVISASGPGGVGWRPITVGPSRVTAEVVVVR